MTKPIIFQIKAITALAVTDTGETAFRDSELSSIWQAPADALATIDGDLRWRWRRQLRAELPGRHSEETA